jgi:hypothetical protein
MTVYGCTISLNAEVLPEVKLTDHKFKRRRRPIVKNLFTYVFPAGL